MCGSEPAQLPSPQSSSGLTVQESHLALQIRSRSELRTASDGTVSERSSTRLRFHYDLTTADGQHIELNVKAKVRQVSFQDAAGNSISKTQVKLQFSLLQEGVVEDLSPLLSDQFPSATQSGVSDGLATFLSSVGDALQQFVEGENGSADDLVRKSVDTFNTLVDALTNLFFPAAGSEAPPALPPSNEPLTEAPAIVALPVSIPEPGPLLPDAADPLPAIPAAASEDETDTVEPVVSAEPAVEPTTVAPALADQSASPSQPDPIAAEPHAADSPAPLATQVLQSARLRFVQSLTQIIRTLTPEEQNGNSSSASSQTLYQSSLSLRIRTASLVDVNV